MPRPLDEQPRVAIAIPLPSAWIYWQTVAALLELERPGESNLMVFQGALLDRARNQLVERFLGHTSRFTHLFFVDSDILLASDSLLRLLRCRAPIVSGLYRRRIPPHEFMAFREASKGPFIPLTLGRGKASIRAVDYVGAGCLLIERSVFLRLKRPWFESRWSRKGHLSEDFSFCQKARRAGFRILVQTQVHPDHIEPMGVGTGPRGEIRFAPLSDTNR